MLGTLPKIIRNDENLYEGDLKHYLRALFFSAQNLHLPYHNFRHICHVLWSCYHACLFYREELSPRQIRNILIAALFHDFDHTGNSKPDTTNIERSLKALDKHLLAEDYNYRDEIKNLIAKTEYPHTFSAEEKLNLSTQIILDADLLQVFSTAWIQQVIFGLAIEHGETPLKILKDQKLFLKSLHFRTKWAQQTFPPHIIEDKISEAEELVALLTDEQ